MLFRSFEGSGGAPGVQNRPLGHAKITLKLAKLTVFLLLSTHDQKYITLPPKLNLGIDLTCILGHLGFRWVPWKTKYTPIISQNKL